MLTKTIFHIRTVGKFTFPKGILTGSSLYFYAVHSHLSEEERELMAMQIDTQLGKTVVLTVKKP